MVTKVRVVALGELYEFSVDPAASAEELLSSVHGALNLPGDPDEYELQVTGPLSFDETTRLEIRAKTLAAFETEISSGSPDGKRDAAIPFLEAKSPLFGSGALPYHSGQRRVKEAKVVFISHATQDQEMARLLVNLLTQGGGIAPANILCTSVAGYRIPPGEDPYEYIRTAMSTSSVVISLITRTFLQSTYCMFETGAAWALGVKRFAIVDADVDYSELPDVLRIQAVKRDDLSGLLECAALVIGHLHLESPDFGRLTDLGRRFAEH